MGSQLSREQASKYLAPSIAFGMVLTSLGGHVRELIVENRPLSTTSLLQLGGSSWGANCREQAIKYQAPFNCFGMVLTIFRGHFGEPIVENRPLSTRLPLLRLAKSLKISALKPWVRPDTLDN